MKATIRQCRGAAIVVEAQPSPYRVGGRVVTTSDGVVKLTPAKTRKLIVALERALLAIGCVTR